LLSCKGAGGLFRILLGLKERKGEISF